MTLYDSGCLRLPPIILIGKSPRNTDFSKCPLSWSETWSQTFIKTIESGQNWVQKEMLPPISCTAIHTQKSIYSLQKASSSPHLWSNKICTDGILSVFRSTARYCVLGKVNPFFCKTLLTFITASGSSWTRWDDKGQ